MTRRTTASAAPAPSVAAGAVFGVIWRGKSAPPDRDYPLFDALLKSFNFSG